jgi:hypothetical protein
MQNNIYYYFSYSPEKPILALQKQVAENLENAPLLITPNMFLFGAAASDAESQAMRYIL